MGEGAPALMVVGRLEKERPLPTPFPGMDPYLEHPGLWPGFHNRLIAALDLDLAPRLRPRYIVSLEERVYISGARDQIGRPDAVVYTPREECLGNGASVREARSSGGAVVLTAAVPTPDQIRETYLEVRDPASGRVITLIELLSPTNKRPGKGREDYLEKRLDATGTRTNLVEIDLLRAGERMPAFLTDWPPDTHPPGDYRILIARGRERPMATMHAFTLRDQIPSFPLPLSPEDDEPPVDLQRLVHTLYETLGYDLRIDYRQEPVPPLEDEDATWAAALLHEQSLR